MFVTEASGAVGPTRRTVSSSKGDEAMFGFPAGRRLPVLLTVVGLVAACATGAGSSPSASVVQGTTPSTTSSVSPSVGPTTSPMPTIAPTAPPDVGPAWSRVDDPDLVSKPRNGSMYGVIAGGPGAIAWGYVYATGPRIWTSVEGLDWTAATIEAVTDADPDQDNPGEILDVTAGGPGYVAVGVYFRAGGDGNTSIVWTSADGTTWERVPADPVFARSRMESVVSWRSELFAYGCENVSPTDCGPQRVWASSDGLVWNVVQLSLPEGTNTVSSVTPSADRLWGRAWLYDESVPAENPTAQVMVTSTDGRTWVTSTLPVVVRSPLHPLTDALYMTVAPWPLPAAQFTPPPTPAGQLDPGVYVSTDLETWTPRSVSLKTVGLDLIAVGDTLVMVGDDAAGNVQCWAKCQATGWRSVDGGKTWETVPADKVGGTMTSVAALPDGTLVSVGRTVDDRGWPSTAAWVSPARNPVGCVSGDNLFTADPRGETGDPVDLARAAIGGIRIGNSVALDGQGEGVARVLVVRGGEQIGFVQFDRDPAGGWLLSQWSLCAGLTVK